jgi:hypothetical protein
MAEDNILDDRAACANRVKEVSKMGMEIIPRKAMPDCDLIQRMTG